MKHRAQLLPCGGPHYSSSRINNRDMNNSGNGNVIIVVIVIVMVEVMVTPAPVILLVVIVPMAVRSTVVTTAMARHRRSNSRSNSINRQGIRNAATTELVVVMTIMLSPVVTTAAVATAVW